MILIFRKFGIQAFNSKQICLTQSWHAIYLMSRNIDFVSMMHKTWKTWTTLDVFRTSNLQMSYYKKNFWPEKFILDICELLNNKSHCPWSLFIKHNCLESEIYFNPTHIYSTFSRIHVFQGLSFLGPCFSGSRFLRVRV